MTYDDWKTQGPDEREYCEHCNAQVDEFAECTSDLDLCEDCADRWCDGCGRVTRNKVWKFTYHTRTWNIKTQAIVEAHVPMQACSTSCVGVIIDDLPEVPE